MEKINILSIIIFINNNDIEFIKNLIKKR